MQFDYKVDVSADITCVHAADSKGQDDKFLPWQETNKRESRNEEINHINSTDDFINPFYAAPDNVNICGDPVSEFMAAVPSSQNGTAGDLPEMFLPGLVIHIVPQKNSINSPSCSSLITNSWSYKAYIANKETFKDIVVSPSMFLDHLPWRYPILIFLPSKFVASS